MQFDCTVYHNEWPVGRTVTRDKAKVLAVVIRNLLRVGTLKVSITGTKNYELLGFWKQEELELAIQPGVLCDAMDKASEVLPKLLEFENQALMEQLGSWHNIVHPDGLLPC